MNPLEVFGMLVMTVLGTVFTILGTFALIMLVLFGKWKTDSHDFFWMLGSLTVGIALLVGAWYLSPLQIIVVR